MTCEIIDFTAHRDRLKMPASVASPGRRTKKQTRSETVRVSIEQGDNGDDRRETQGAAASKIDLEKLAHQLVDRIATARPDICHKAVCGLAQAVVMHKITLEAAIMMPPSAREFAQLAETIQANRPDLSDKACHALARNAKEAVVDQQEARHIAELFDAHKEAYRKYRHAVAAVAARTGRTVSEIGHKLAADKRAAARRSMREG